MSGTSRSIQKRTPPVAMPLTGPFESMIRWSEVKRWTYMSPATPVP